MRLLRRLCIGLDRLVFDPYQPMHHRSVLSDFIEEITLYYFTPHPLKGLGTIAIRAPADCTSEASSDEASPWSKSPQGSVAYRMPDHGHRLPCP